MSAPSEWLLRVAGVALVVAGVLVASWRRAGRGRWGTALGPPRRGGTTGPYRGAALQEPFARPAPSSIVLASALSAGWGLLTTAVLAPSGIGFLLSPLRNDAPSLLLGLSGVAVFAMAVAGAVLGLELVRAARALLLRETGVAAKVMPVATWSVVHHLTVLLVFTGIAAREQTPLLSALVALPCAAGIGISCVLAHAARRAEPSLQEEPHRAG